MLRTGYVYLRELVIDGVFNKDFCFFFRVNVDVQESVYFIREVPLHVFAGPFIRPFGKKL